ncbi:hypothetical protein CLU79DRAFT_736006 [Phycomyces nitens]|nr:hypothetical protein CLU79DRAFT_736006 [Phycomyces nitens]
MTYYEEDQDDVPQRRVPSKPTRQRSFLRTPIQPKTPPTAQPLEEFSTAISWPILLAVIPTLGAFIAGSAEVWSDFIMILLILYYVYKWITVPWSYYESARSRRMIHQNATSYADPLDDRKRGTEFERRRQLAYELRRHELMGLMWVIASPALAGYTLQYSRYFLSNYDKYVSSFNVTVFVFAASLKPLAHVMLLLRERTLYLQSEMQVQESETQRLQRKLDIMEEELIGLRKAFATKKDLGQATEGLGPTLEQLTKAMRRCEKKETALRACYDERFTAVDKKVREFDQFICYRIEQDQRKSTQRAVATLLFLPLNITFWVAKRMTRLLPIPRALLGSSTPTRGTKPSALAPHRPHRYRSRSQATPSRHLTHPDLTNSPDQFGAFYGLPTETEQVYSGEESLNSFDQH